MASTATSAVQQLNAHPVLSALPENFAISAPDCNTYKTYRPIIAAAIPLITSIIPKAGAALTFLMNLADGVCGVAPSAAFAATPDSRRQLANAILDKSASDPQWRAQLVSNPKAALESAFGPQLAQQTAAGALAADDCSFSCIIST